MDIKYAINYIVQQQAKMQAFSHAANMLYFDSLTTAPKGGSEEFAQSMGVLSEAEYNLLVNNDMEHALDYLNEHLEDLDPLTAAQVKELTSQLNKSRRIPVEEYVAYEVLRNKAESAWHEAKYTNNYPLFGDYLARIIETCKRFSDYYAPGEDAYNVQLDGFQKGNTRQALDEYFSVFRRDILPLFKRISQAGDCIDNSFLFRTYPIDSQRRLSSYIMDVMTLDRKHCALAETEHPRTMIFHKNDVRITTHYYPNKLHASLYSTIHESGHAVYELNTGDALKGTVLARGISMGMGESQSRFFENIIGRSREFIDFLFPKLTELFPEQLHDVSAEKFYQAVNKVQASSIRMEADELTYSIHIMIRYELEKMLFDDALHTRDLPEAWNALYKEYLGIQVEDDSHGVLQDNHWSHGSFGSFPCYYLGNCYGAQFVENMKQDFDVTTAVREGNMRPLIKWLTERIYQYGKSIDAAQAIYNCTGTSFNPEYYNRYLIKKFGDLYGV